MGLQEDTRHFTADIFLTRFDTMDQDPFFRELFQHIKKELLEHNCHLGELQTLTDITQLSTLSSVSGKIKIFSGLMSRWIIFILRQNSFPFCLTVPFREICPLSSSDYSKTGYRAYRPGQVSFQISASSKEKVSFFDRYRPKSYEF